MKDGNNRSITEIRKKKFADQIGMDVSTDGSVAVADSYFEEYSNSRDYDDDFEGAFNGKYLVDLIDAAWDAKPPYKLLDCGSATVSLSSTSANSVSRPGVSKTTRSSTQKRRKSCERATCSAMCCTCLSRIDLSICFMSRACPISPKTRSIKRSRRCSGFVV